jgi:hypothetical protein
VKRIKFLENTPVKFWLFMTLTILVVLIVLTWLVKHPPWDEDERTFGYDNLTAAVATA